MEIGVSYFQRKNRGMRYLFVVQGEGRGHLTQAISLSNLLRSNGHEVVEVLVGKCQNREIPSFFMENIGTRVRRFNSPLLDYGKSGKKAKIIKSVLQNTTPRSILKWQKSIDTIARRVEKCKPDVVINFYELLMGFTCLVHRLRVPVISVAHQFLIDHPDYQHRSKTDYGQLFLRMNNILCSIGTTKTLALSFYPMKDFYRDRIAVVPPLLRSEVKQMTPYNSDHILGYILNPAYMDEIKVWNRRNPEQKLHLFWDKKDAASVESINSSLTLHRIHDTKFLELMEGCSGYVTTAGFESICEAMYLGKPVMMIPAHVEQEINAKDAEGAGAGIISDSFNITRLINFIPKYSADTQAYRQWVDSADETFLRHLTTFI